MDTHTHTLTLALTKAQVAVKAGTGVFDCGMMTRSNAQVCVCVGVVLMEQVNTICEHLHWTRTRR